MSLPETGLSGLRLRGYVAEVVEQEFKLGLPHAKLMALGAEAYAPTSPQTLRPPTQLL